MATRTVIAVCVTFGLFTLVLAIHRLAVSGVPGPATLVFAAVFGLLVIGSWVWPMVVYVGDQSYTFDLDEGFFVLLILLVPATTTVLVFAVATVVAQAIRRRPLIKSIFNVGQVLTAIGAGLVVFELLQRSQASIGYARVGAALAAAVVNFVVNTNAVAILLKTLGTPWRKSLLGGFGAKTLVLFGSIALAIPTAYVLARDPEFLPVAVFPLLILRYLAAGHFYARHDRERLRGLFEAALEINGSIGNEETREAILSSARSLLRSSEATLALNAPDTDTLSAPVGSGDGRLWLTVSGRSRTEIFDMADQALLDALASVGAVALTNAALYEEVQRQKESLSVITDSMGEGVCAINQQGEITFMNLAASEMLGWIDPVPGAGPPINQAKSAAPPFLLAPALRALAGSGAITIDNTPFQHSDGTSFPVTMTASSIVDGGVSSGAVIVFRDISERKQFEEQLARHAFQDALTGLPNRRLLLDNLDYALLRAERTKEHVALVFCDVDRFKVVNDNLGHKAGDELLVAIADRLRAEVRPEDMLARFGGDEFIVLLKGVASQDAAIRVAQRMLESLLEPISLTGGHEVVATVSMGIAINTPGKFRDDLLHDADVAMYQAKARGRGGNYEVFDVDVMGERSASRIELEADLRRAVERDEVEVYYQPLISFADRRVIGAEALVRWNHPQHGLLAPAQFIQLAEDTGLILPIGRAVLERACLQAREWRESLGITTEISVNLSARQFRQKRLLEEIEQVLADTGVDPGQLCLEITESLAMDDVELTSAILHRLRELGVRVAIDDFGTGYSSLGYLAQFPIDVVKIDRSFIENIEHDPIKSAIVSAIVALSQAIGTTTVVEGVETIAQLELLKTLGCSVAQGYYFARPMPAWALGDLLRHEVWPLPAEQFVRGELLTC